jgi:hypothetical protein
MNKDERTAELAAKLTATDRSERIWSKGEFRDVPIFRAPTALLYLNDDNRRFRAEAQGAVAELGRPLDAMSNPEDEKSIMSLLLDRDPHVEDDNVLGKPSKEAKALLVDWERRGQEKPFWIRPDGLVVNGNRRLAMIKRQQAEAGASFSDWVDVVIFTEEDYDHEVLFDLEASEQLTEGLKVRYSDINVLLTLRDAADREEVDWLDADSVKAVAARIQHLVSNNPDYAIIQLNAIKYMDLYLEDIESPGEYHRLQRMVERFREVGKTMAAVAADDPTREDRMLGLLFAAIQANSTHLDIRALRMQWREEPEEFDRLYRYVQTLEEEAEPEEEDEPGGPDVDIDDEDDEAEAEAEPPPATPGYPKHAVKRALDSAVQAVTDAKQRDKHGHVLTAAARLAVISAEDLASHLGDNAEGHALRDAISAVVAWADLVRPLIDTNRPDVQA